MLQLKQNKKWLSVNEGQEKAESHYLQFVHNGSTMAIPVDEVVEVLDSWNLSEYPEPFEQHIGVVHVRGNILPVISCGHLACNSETPAGSDRLIVLSDHKAGEFGILASQVRKFSSSSEVRSLSTINVDGKPVLQVRSVDLLGKIANAS